MKMVSEYPLPLKVNRTVAYVEIATGERYEVVGSNNASIQNRCEPMIELMSWQTATRRITVPLTRFIREFVDADVWAVWARKEEDEQVEVEPCIEAVPDGLEPSTEPSIYELAEYARVLQTTPDFRMPTGKRLDRVYDEIEKRLGITESEAGNKQD